MDLVGARIVIHGQGEKAYPDDEGIDIHAGMSTSIGLRKVSISQLPTSVL